MAAQDDPMRRAVMRCRESEAFEERLLVDPSGVLTAQGVQIPEGVIVNGAGQGSCPAALPQ